MPIFSYIFSSIKFNGIFFAFSIGLYLVEKNLNVLDFFEPVIFFYPALLDKKIKLRSKKKIIKLEKFYDLTDVYGWNLKVHQQWLSRVL